MTPRWVPGTLVLIVALGAAVALPASAQTLPPPPGTPVSPPPTGVVPTTPPPTTPPTTEPRRPVLGTASTPPPTTATSPTTTAPPPPRRSTAPAVRPAPSLAPPDPGRPGPTASPSFPASPVVRRPGPGTTASATAPADRRPSTVVATGDGLVPLDAPIPDLPAPTAVEDGLGERTAPTQRRLVPRPTDDEVAAPATAAARSRSHHGLLRSELVPLLLLGGAVATAYVACLQVAERRRQRRVAGR